LWLIISVNELILCLLFESIVGLFSSFVNESSVETKIITENIYKKRGDKLRQNSQKITIKQLAKEATKQTIAVH